MFTLLRGVNVVFVALKVPFCFFYHAFSDSRRESLFSFLWSTRPTHSCGRYSDHYFRMLFPYVLQNIAKQNKHRVKIMITTSVAVGLGQVDHWCLVLFTFSYSFFLLPLYESEESFSYQKTRPKVTKKNNDFFHDITFLTFRLSICFTCSYNPNCNINYKL